MTHVVVPSQVSAAAMRIGLVVSRYHAAITGAMRDAAVARFGQAGGLESNLVEMSVPGAFELTAVSRALAHDGAVDAVVALGCVVTGETTHDQHIAAAVAQGLTRVTCDTGVPIAFGVLTCQTVEQAEARAGGTHGNKGDEAMAAAIEAAAAIRGLRDATRSVP